MNPLQTPALKILCSILAVLPLAGGLPFAAAAEPSPAPNILLILTDDQNADTVAAYGRNPNAESPAIDKLADEGVLFENAFVNTPQCVTSRISLAMGKYPHHVASYDFSKIHSDTDFYKPPFYRVLFEERDYFNALVGKDHTYFRYKDGIVKHGRKYPRIWEAALRKSRDAPDRDFYPRRKDEDGVVRITRNIEPDPEDDDKYGVLRGYTNEHPTQRLNIWAGYSDRGWGETQDDYILKDFRTIVAERLAADDGRPTFMNLSFVFPHTPILPPEEIARRFEEKDFEIPGFSARELEHIREHVPQMAEFIRLMKSYDMTDAEKEKVLQHIYAYAAYGHILAGEAIEEWKAFSEAQGRPWLIVFTSDHGWHIHEHGIATKFTMYDESVRTPLIIASSDKDAFPPMTRYEGLVEFVDLAPTFLKAAGIDPYDPVYADNFDGVPLQDLVSGEQPPKERILCETGHGVIGWRALYRTERWAFSMKHRPDDMVLGEDMQWATRQSPETLQMMLFDLENDPEEKHNLAYDPRYEAVRDELRAKLEAEILGPTRREFDWKANPLPPFQR
jgi:arylsulfatase A-like enzyme